eukprot:213838-Chlamydomonas_euryale.AAC.2
MSFRPGAEALGVTDSAATCRGTRGLVIEVASTSRLETILQRSRCAKAWLNRNYVHTQKLPPHATEMNDYYLKKALPNGMQQPEEIRQLLRQASDLHV